MQRSSWLTNEQAAADSANFMANVKFDGIDEDLTAPGTPWIYYGVCRTLVVTQSTLYPIRRVHTLVPVPPI